MGKDSNGLPIGFQVKAFTFLVPKLFPSAVDASTVFNLNIINFNCFFTPRLTCRLSLLHIRIGIASLSPGNWRLLSVDGNRKEKFRNKRKLICFNFNYIFTDAGMKLERTKIFLVALIYQLSVERLL